VARKTKKEAQETRAGILDAAVDVFFEHGISRTSLEDIARAAGVTRGAIYWHFDNKVDIFRALHERLYTSYVGEIADTLAQNHDAPLRGLEEFFVNIMLRLQREDQPRKMLTMCMMKCDYSGDMAVFLAEQNKKKTAMIALLEKFFLRAREIGTLRAEGDTHTLALSLCCYVSGVFFEYIRVPGLIDLQKEARPLMRAFFARL